MSKRKPSQRKEVERALKPRLARERSKHADKIFDRNNPSSKSLTKYYFYNEKTFNDYVKRGVAVMNYARERTGHRIPFEEASKYVIGYLDERKKLVDVPGGITARTLAKERTELSKLFLCDLTHYEIPECKTESNKGRIESPHWSRERNKEAWDFYCAVGARRNEYRYLKPEEVKKYKEQAQKVGINLKPDLHGRVSNLQPHYDAHGSVCAITTVVAKHGKTNTWEVLPKDREMITELFKTGEYDKFFNPSKAAQTHEARRQKAQSHYDMIKRDVNELPRKEIYKTRDGKMYDKQAVGIVSEGLGHSKNRDFDTIHNYFR